MLFMTLVAVDHDFLTSTIQNHGPCSESSRSEIFDLLNGANRLIVDRPNDISRPKTCLLCGRTGLNIEHGHT